MSLRGRRALVTGGGRGIGRAAALALAGAGADVAVAARTSAEVEAVAAEARGRGVRGAALTADVGRADEVRRLFQAARDALGGVDILVASAGVAPSAPLARTTDEMWSQVMAANLSGPFYCLREALPEMAGRGWGRVVVLASIAGKSAMPYIAAYAASKHGVLGLTKVAALEVAGKGVTVNAVCPGYVDTPMTDGGVARIAEKTGGDPAAIRRRLEELSPQKRLVTAEEVAALVLYLCGDEARGITGQGLNVDGGTLM
ncbi:MAG TPA: SDR family oxidoreductase [Vicinamibacteria bacterium]|nr:SDR family oxidoreductase [Vicinamibacteria bacterium]